MSKDIRFNLDANYLSISIYDVITEEKKSIVEVKINNRTINKEEYQQKYKTRRVKKRLKRAMNILKYKLCTYDYFN